MHKMQSGDLSYPYERCKFVEHLCAAVLCKNCCYEVKIVSTIQTTSLVPRPRPAFRRLQYGKAVEGLE